VTYDPDILPTDDELIAAWRLLFQHDVTAIADLSMPELSRIVDNRITNTDERERRLARALVVMRAQYESLLVDLAAARADAVRANAEATANRREMVRLDGELGHANKVLDDLRATYQSKVG
jgi:hypothetical protein